MLEVIFFVTFVAVIKTLFVAVVIQNAVIIIVHIAIAAIDAICFYC